MNNELNRREFLQTNVALVVGLTGSAAFVGDAAAQAAAPAVVGPNPSTLDTWVRIATSGEVTVNFGKMDCGQGVDLAIAQVVAEELDVPLAAVRVVVGDTRYTTNQGGGSGSTGLRMGAKPLRNAAAEARRVLMEMGSAQLGVPVAALTVSDGVISIASDPGKRVTYAQLIGGKNFDTPMKWNNAIGNGMNVEGQAKPKPVSEYKIVGKGVKRTDIAHKVTGVEHFTAHIRPDNLLHARAVRPQFAGAMPESVDATSISHIPGAKHFIQGGFVAVVAETEWNAVRASRALKVKWSNPPAAFPGGEARLFDYIREATPTASNAVPIFAGKKDYDTKPTMAALAASKRVVEAEYECAFQSHARISPSCGVADVKGDRAEIWADTQKPHYVRDGIAKFLGLPAGNVQVKWMPGAGSYGRSDADEAPYEAALLSKNFGRPVRMQWSREEGTAWDPKAPAAVVSMKAGLSDTNDVTGWYFRAKGFNGWDVKFYADGPEQTLVGMLTGHKKTTTFNFNTPEESYKFPNHVHWWETVPPYLENASPLRTAHMRAPQEMQTRFAQESFIDEVAHAAGKDPVAFRLEHMQDPREKDVLRAATEKLGWKSSTPARNKDKVSVGRGVSVHAGYGSYACAACEVEVHRDTGRIRVRKMVVALDCGLMVNPIGLRAALEGQIMQGLSRALYEEVHFDERKVTSTDWYSYRIAKLEDAPMEVELVLLNRPDMPIGGAGEPAIVCFPPAVANAVFNATGVRMRRYPLSPESVKKALSA
ncbi:MAG: molybdopterin cofactor-binding domain-containing protein [Pseudomonadota bacterium]